MRWKIIVSLATMILSVPVWQDSAATTATDRPAGQFSGAIRTDLDATLVSWQVHPWAIPADGHTQTIITATVSDTEGSIERVSLDLTALGGEPEAPLYDDGAHNDDAPNDGTFGLIATAAVTAESGETPLYLTITSQGGAQTIHYLGAFLVLTPLDVPWPASLPDHLGWGTMEADWQHETGLPWNYQSRFLTWNWQSWNSTYVRDIVQSAWSYAEVPMFTFDMLLGAGACDGLGEKECDFAHLQDQELMQNYFERVRAAAQQASGDQPVIFHIEPDVSAYMQRYSIEHNGENGIIADKPDTIPAWNESGYPNSYAGVIHRLMDIIGEEAPNVLVALHARSWATGVDVAGTDRVDLDVDEIAQRTAHFLTEAAGPELDLVIVDWKNIDAGAEYGIWWDDTNRTLPHFNRMLHWENQLAFHSARALMLWRVPVGNMDLPNVCNQYQDNRVDYAFTHGRDLVGAGVMAISLGGGQECRTDPSTDGGNVAAKAAVYYAVPATPRNFSAAVLGPAGVVRASWSPNEEFDLWGYRIYYGRSADQMTRHIDVQRMTTLHTIIPGGGRWLLSVVAYDVRGIESPLSPAVVVETGEPHYLYLPFSKG